ncbi:hypothetical protein Pla100_57660 [Neorhodopirellula pilleata]|uniref:Uncharacterized protein n=1 Tax=Neorhodopirellula pilleata TaxID=2714738 RepID=A0A5C5ZLI4_9BACT|nr:hypothetical protein Pla100_57660 [Neorhodopirellula pilleata]
MNPSLTLRVTIKSTRRYRVAADWVVSVGPVLCVHHSGDVDGEVGQSSAAGDFAGVINAEFDVVVLSQYEHGDLGFLRVDNPVFGNTGFGVVGAFVFLRGQVVCYS